MSDLLHFSEHTLQEVALLFMALVYILRVIWFLRFKAGKERQAPTAPGGVLPSTSQRNAIGNTNRLGSPMRTISRVIGRAQCRPRIPPPKTDIKEATR